jgi:hypothetical protein
MPQQSWSYRKSLDDVPYHVSIYHGDKSRHVIIYSQSNIVTIDFKVFGDKTYSFMLGEELFELQIAWVNVEPKYKLIHVPTQRIVEDPGFNNYPRTDIIKALLFIFALANVAVLIAVAFKK